MVSHHHGYRRRMLSAIYSTFTMYFHESSENSMTRISYFRRKEQERMRDDPKKWG